MIVGTRPQLIKVSELLKEAKRRDIETTVIDTGQHYDFTMSGVFLKELDLCRINYENLDVGSGSHGWQTGTMIVRLEESIRKVKPDIAVVFGDTNSTLAGALATVKLGIPLAHIEAGARSFDMTMPEEVNRRLTDHCSNLLFASTKNCVRNLEREGLKNHVYLVGDIMYDLLLSSMSKIKANNVIERLDLENKPYGVLTIHRPTNLGHNRFRKLLECIDEAKETIIFPVHPRTKEVLEEDDKLSELNIRVTPPLSYYEIMKLVSRSKVVITDSGGLQKEAFWLHVPCLTLRKTTEWIETVRLGANELIANNLDILTMKIKKIFEDQEDIKYHFNPLATEITFGNGDASQKILDVILSYA